jgi:hypothetical protein
LAYALHIYQQGISPSKLPSPRISHGAGFFSPAIVETLSA